MAKGQGWHKDSKRHAEAAKGNKTTGKSTSSSNTNQGSGWYGDTEGHSEAAKGETPKKKGGLFGL